MGSSAEKREGGGVSQKKRSTVMGSDDSRECSFSSAEEGTITKDESECPLLSATTLGRPIMQVELSAGRKSVPSLESVVASAEEVENRDEVKQKKLGSKLLEVDMMKERFAKLLLGEDMSGSGKGVCTALAISNAITNLYAAVFGQLWRLEPLPDERKSMWQREMEWLLSIGDHIVELIPSSQTFPDGRKLEVMTSRPRSDIFINLPALRKLDNILLDILNCFKEMEFWYVDQGVIASNAAERPSSFRKTVERQEEKWWLPVPRVPSGGLSENSREQLNRSRESVCQILKAAMAINSLTLSEMEVPDSYLDALPKHGKDSLGEVIYRYMVSDRFSADCLLDCLDLSSEHVALEIANRVEASICIWRQRARARSRPPPPVNRSAVKPSWGTMVKDLMVDIHKRELLADKAERLLLNLKQRFPCLSQTNLDASKIQFNKDVGKSIIESYSRVLESLAFNIMARIDDILYVDDLTRHSDKLSPSSVVNPIAQSKSCFPHSVPISSTPYGSAFSTPSFSPSPASFISTPFILNNVKPNSEC